MNEAGFTLAELLVVVGIVVGLAAVILPNVGRFACEGTRGASATEMSSVQTARQSRLPGFGRNGTKLTIRSFPAQL